MYKPVRFPHYEVHSLKTREKIAAKTLQRADIVRLVRTRFQDIDFLVKAVLTRPKKEIKVREIETEITPELEVQRDFTLTESPMNNRTEEASRLESHRNMTIGGEEKDTVVIKTQEVSPREPLVPVQAEPVNEEPAKVEPVQEEPVREEPAKVAEIQAEPEEQTPIVAAPEVQEEAPAQVESEEVVKVEADIPEVAPEDPKKERSYIMIKPDGVHRGAMGKIIRKFEEKGLKLVAMKMVIPTEELLQSHYEVHKGKPFYEGLLKYVGSGPVIPMVWEGLDAVNIGRKIIGKTNPLEADSTSVRGEFAVVGQRNLIHGSDSVDNAQLEISLWFPPEEVISWDKNICQMVYGNNETAMIKAIDGLDAAEKQRKEEEIAKEENPVTVVEEEVASGKPAHRLNEYQDTPQEDENRQIQPEAEAPPVQNEEPENQDLTAQPEKQDHPTENELPTQEVQPEAVEQEEKVAEPEQAAEEAHPEVGQEQPEITEEQAKPEDQEPVIEQEEPAPEAKLEQLEEQEKPVEPEVVAEGVQEVPEKAEGLAQTEDQKASVEAEQPAQEVPQEQEVPAPEVQPEQLEQVEQPTEDLTKPQDQEPVVEQEQPAQEIQQEPQVEQQEQVVEQEIVAQETLEKQPEPTEEQTKPEDQEPVVEQEKPAEEVLPEQQEIPQPVEESPQVVPQEALPEDVKETVVETPPQNEPKTTDANLYVIDIQPSTAEKAAPNQTLSHISKVLEVNGHYVVAKLKY